MTLPTTFPVPIEKDQEQMSLLSVELSRERIRDAERDLVRRRGIAQARALRRSRRAAEMTAVRLRRLLTTR